MSLSDTDIYFLPVAVPGVRIKVTSKSHASVPDVVSSTLTLNILPSVTLVIGWRETVASVEEGYIGYATVSCFMKVNTVCLNLLHAYTDTIQTTNINNHLSKTGLDTSHSLHRTYFSQTTPHQLH